MADLDKFVLAYEVKLNDSIKRLESLQEKMSKVNKTHEETAKGMKEASAAMRAFGESMGGIASGVAKLTAAGTAIVGVVEAIRMLNSASQSYMNDFNNGVKTGIAPTMLENMSRNATRFSSGLVSNADAKSQFSNFANLANAARAQPAGQQAGVLRLAGIDPTSSGGVPEMIGQVADFTKRTGNEGPALQMGFSPQMVQAMKEQGRAIIEHTAMTQADIKAYNDASAAAKEFQQNMGEASEAMRKAGTGFTNWTFKALRGVWHGLQSTAMAEADSAITMSAGMGDKTANSMIDPKTGKVADSVPLTAAEKKLQEKKQADEAAKAKAERDRDQAQFQQLRDQQNQWQLITDLFSQSVQTFAGTVSRQEADAAWAGTAGAAAGLGGVVQQQRFAATGSTNFIGTPNGSGAGMMAGGSNWKSSQYAAQIEAAAKQYGLDPQLVWSVMMAESSGVNGRISNTDARGLMQVTRGNWRAYGGGQDVMDPTANIQVGARILKESIAMAHGNLAAGLNQYNGHSDPNYVGKVMGFMGGSNDPMGAYSTDYKAQWAFSGGTKVGGALGTDALRRRQVAGMIADILHVPVQQVLSGDISQGDRSFALDSVMRSLQVKQAQLKAAESAESAVGSMNPGQRAALVKQQRDLGVQLANVNSFAADVAANAKAGGRSLSLGQMPPVNANFTINGATDPHAVATEVNRQMTTMLINLRNNYSTGLVN